MLSPHPRGPAFLLDQVLPYGRTPQGIPVIDVRQSHNRVRALRFRLLAEYVGKPFAIRSLLSIPASDSDSARRVFLPFLHRWIRCANEFFFPSAFPKAIRQILNFHKVDDEVDRIKEVRPRPSPDPALERTLHGHDPWKYGVGVKNVGDLQKGLK